MAASMGKGGSDDPASNIKSKNEIKEDWGYDMYPERKGKSYKSSWFQTAVFGEGREGLDKMKCEEKVLQAFEKNPIVKLLVSALHGSGCPLDIRRHISCEVCDSSVTGGYDTESNQIVVCSNMCKTQNMVDGTLAHELIHMFDYCRKDLEFKNLEHLACTEIRAANLVHCSFMSAFLMGYASFFNIANTHSICVKAKAVDSIRAVRLISLEEAIRVVDKVFDKCYNDLEPLGRRLRRGSRNAELAYVERHCMGYD